MLLSIIIPNYDTIEGLRECLASIYGNSDSLDFEVIIINNGSKVDTVESIRNLDARPRILNLSANVGFGMANNIAVRRALGEYILLLNSDTFFLEDSLSKVEEYTRSNPGVDIFGCEVFNPDLSPQPAYRYCEPGRPLRKDVRTLLERNPFMEKWRRYFPREKIAEKPTEHFWISGCCLFAKRKIFLESGGFDPDFFLYFEETEWFFNRIFPRNYKVGYCPEVKVVHIEGASQPSKASREQLELSRYLFYHKLGMKTFLKGVSLTLFNTLTRIAIMPFIPHFWSENVRIVRQETKLLARVLIDIPSHSREYGSRPAPLITTTYSENYSWAQLADAAVEEAAGEPLEAQQQV